MNQNRNNLLIGLSIGGGVLLLLALVAAVSFFIAAIGKGVGMMHVLPGESQGNYENAAEVYEPDEKDSYYLHIVDATRTDLDYTILWAEEALNPDDQEESWSYYTTYPVLKAAEHKQGDYESINQAIRTAALQYKKDSENYPGGANTSGYVTYMDEEKISVVFQHSLYTTDGNLPRLQALTFEIKTGRLIPHNEMLLSDTQLAMRFRSQDAVQNGGVKYVQELSDEELLEILLKSEEAVMFYTPVGLEAGFNYDEGWVTVTLKEQTL